MISLYHQTMYLFLKTSYILKHLFSSASLAFFCLWFICVYSTGNICGSFSYFPHPNVGTGDSLSLLSGWKHVPALSAFWLWFALVIPSALHTRYVTLPIRRRWLAHLCIWCVSVPRGTSVCLNKLRWRTYSKLGGCTSGFEELPFRVKHLNH